MFLPKRLIFSGGGTRCLVFLPALLRLEKENRLLHVNEWWGTSAGSLLATLLALTKSANQVSTVMKGIDYVKFRDVDLLNMVQMTTSWGFDDGKSLTREVEAMMETAKTGSSAMTMSDISGLKIVVADLTLHETIVCSAETFPTLRVVDAIRASMSLPLFYRPFRSPVNGNIWVDGGLKAHFPWNLLPSDAARKEAMGFAFDRTWMNGPTSFSEYFFSMLHFEEPHKIRHLKQKWKQNILWFPSPPFPAWYVRLQPDDFAILDQMGNATIEEWFTESSKIPQTQQLSSPPRTPSPTCQKNHTSGMLDTRECPCPPQPPCPFQDSPPETRLPSRRWSL